MLLFPPFDDAAKVGVAFNNINFVTEVAQHPVNYFLVVLIRALAVLLEFHPEVQAAPPKVLLVGPTILTMLERERVMLHSVVITPLLSVSLQCFSHVWLQLVADRRYLHGPA